jgi:tight adherence protein C
LIIVFIFGFLFLAMAIVLALRAVALPRVRMSDQMRQIRSYGFNTEIVAPAAPDPFTIGLRRVAERVGAFMRANAPSLKPVRRSQLASAGFGNLSADVFHGYRTLFALAFPGIVFLAGVASGKFSFLTFALIVVGLAAAWVLPAAAVRRRGQARLDRIDRALPELVDVLTATIEAGLGFGASLQLVAQRFDGPLGEELRFTLQEQTMGLSTERALANLLERCETPSMRAFVRAVQQGETLGVSIGQMMRSLAAETRKRRRQAAREQVLKAPTKMLFPLIFLIFPALLIVLLYPAASEVITQLGGT